MKIRNNKNKVSVLALAVQSALFVMPFATVSLVAQAADAANDEALALKRPSNSIQLGGLNVSSDSAKFGEYNGLDESELYGIANIDVRGGNAYGEGGGIMRWQIKGTDLGTSSRELAATVSSQGQWSLGIGYDELKHNLTDGYQTPYLGRMGGNQFSLPAGFGTVADTNLMTTTQKATFHTIDVSSKRKNTSFTAGYNINPEWDVTLDINHLNQSGAKLMAFASAANTAAPALLGQRVSILPTPTNYTTDTVNLAVNWAGDTAHLNVAYFGSFFQNEYNRVNFTTFAGANATQTMSTAPDNHFHQLNLLGGYVFSPHTKLAGGLSYGRNTQDDSFAYDTFMNPASPKSSLNGVVINTHGDLKLTDNTIKNLTLSAGVKYDERDNRTESNIYSFKAVGNAGTGGAAIYPNTPLSNRKTQWELAGDYRISSKQHIRLAYNRENISRWCNHYAVNANYPAGTNCVVATDSADDMLSANYKLNASENLHLNAGYSYSDRDTDSDSKAIAAFNSTRGNVSGGTVKGINAGDYLGFYPYFNASRKQQTLKAGVDWQAHEKLSLGLNGRYTDDDYDSQYGVQKGNTWSLNLDSTFNYSNNGSISAYISKAHRERDMTNVQSAVPIILTWSNQLDDDDITFGLSAKHGGLMKRKLELSGDLTYSLAETGYGTQLNYTLVPTACSALSINTCGQLPDIKNKLLQLKLIGDYKVSKHENVAVAYQYQRLTSSDYFYSPYQTGATPREVLPTNQQDGSYSVNLVTATYTYTFQ